ncbi:MAG: hypothetical protein IJ357_02095 [Oscillospiraceae bacterium]|nr:hypothetical protein [Oscillospiraceae bacterium]
MKRKAEKRKHSGSKWPRVLLLIPVLTVGLAMLGAKLIVSGTVSETAVQTLAILITAIVGLCMGLIGAAVSPQKKLLWGLLAALTAVLAMILGNLLFFGVTYSRILPGVGATLGGGVLGALLGSKKRKKYH